MDKNDRGIISLSIITAINVLVATGYSIVGVVNPTLIMPVTSVITDSTLIFAMYAGARTIPLAVLALWAIVKRSRKELIILGVLAGLMQFFDGFIGLYQGDMGKTIGPFVLAILQFVALTMLLKKVQRKA